MAEKYACRRTVVCGTRKLPISCPLCGGDRFYYREIAVDVYVSIGFRDIDKNLICSNCGKIQIFSDDAVIEDLLTPVEQWEKNIIDWGDNKEKKLLKILKDTKNYNEDARTAAENLLKKLKHKGEE